MTYGKRTLIAFDQLLNTLFMGSVINLREANHNSL